MESAEVDKSNGAEDTTQLTRNRSFKSKQLVRSQAIRESQSPPRALSPRHPSPSVDSPPPSASYSPPNVASASPKVATPTDERTADNDDSSHVSVRCSDVKTSDSDDYNKKKLPVEIQVTSGGWETEAQCSRQRTRRWLSDDGRDLLSNNPRVACVCGTCAACPHCRGRRRRRACPSKQDSGIGCSDDCADCLELDHDAGGNNNNDVIRKANSLEVDDQNYYCRCPDRKERVKNASLSRNDSDDRNEISGPELVAFIKDTLNKNPRDRMQLLRIEKELHSLVNDTGRCIVRFPVMTSYGRMLVHRCAALFQLSHHLDQTNKTSVLVSKSGTSGGRIPCTSFKQWCCASFPPSPRHQPDTTRAKSILKRDTHSLDEPGAGSLANNRSKSLEQREREYERVRRRIFSTEEQWPWLSGPVKVLTPEGGRNKLLKVQSLEGREGPGPGSGSWRGRGAVSKSHSFGGYEPAQHQSHQPRLLSRQGDLASSSWRLSPSSSGYKTLSLRSTDSVTPSPTGGASPEPRVAWAVTDLAAVPAGARLLHPQTGRPLTNPDGSIYHFDPANPPVLYDPNAHHNEQKTDNNEKRRGKLEKQHSFIDNECECPPTEDCRGKCCYECRRHTGTQHTSTAEKETNTKPATPIHYDIQPTKQDVPTSQPDHEVANQRPPAQETANQKPAYDVRHDGAANQRPRANEEYQQYRNDEVTSPPQMHPHFVPPEVLQAKLTPLPIPDPNMRPMSLTGMTNIVYPTAIPQPYPYPCRVEPHLQMYPQMVQAEEPKIAPSPHTNETAFRIDPSYPYASVDYGACGGCIDTSAMQPQQARSVGVGVGVGYAGLEAPPYAPVLLPAAHTLHHYPYQEAVPWTGVAAAHKLVVPELYPIVPYPQPAYQHYNIMYPQVIPQPYPICQPVYPYVEKPPETHPHPHPAQRRNSQPGNRTPKRSSAANSARATPMDDKVPYDDTRHNTTDISIHRQNSDTIHRQNSEVNHNIHRQNSEVNNHNIHRQNSEVTNHRQNSESVANHRQNSDTINRQNSEPMNQNRQNSDANRQNCEIAAKIQQIKNQMAQMNTKERDGRSKNEWRRRNSGNGLLGNCPVNNYNGRVMSRPPNDEAHLSTAARAIVNSIRNMQAKNTYQEPRREQARPEPGEHPASLYRQPYVLRQMSPGTWCRRSPAPVHPVLNPPRRPHPDARNPRR